MGLPDDDDAAATPTVVGFSTTPGPDVDLAAQALAATVHAYGPEVTDVIVVAPPLPSAAPEKASPLAQFGWAAGGVAAVAVVAAVVITIITTDYTRAPEAVTPSALPPPIVETSLSVTGTPSQTTETSVSVMPQQPAAAAVAPPQDAQRLTPVPASDAPPETGSRLRDLISRIFDRP